MSVFGLDDFPLGRRLGSLVMAGRQEMIVSRLSAGQGVPYAFVLAYSNVIN